MADKQTGRGGGDRSRRDADDVSWAFREANQAAAELDVALARRLGLKQTDYDAMAHLMSSAEPLGPNELGRRLGIAPASSTELVDRLEAAGHVQRTRSQSDRRRVELRAEPSSVGRIVGELTPLLEELDEIAGRLGPAERRAVLAYLTAVGEATRRFVLEELER